jgi:hypothetical protein
VYHIRAGEEKRRGSGLLSGSGDFASDLLPAKPHNFRAIPRHKRNGKNKRRGGQVPLEKQGKNFDKHAQAARDKHLGPQGAQIFFSLYAARSARGRDYPKGKSRKKKRIHKQDIDILLHVIVIQKKPREKKNAAYSPEKKSKQTLAYAPCDPGRVQIFFPQALYVYKKNSGKYAQHKAAGPLR